MFETVLSSSAAALLGRPVPHMNFAAPSPDKIILFLAEDEGITKMIQIRVPTCQVY